MIQQIAYDASMKMHFLGAIHRWCSERGEVPYMNVVVSDQVQVPMTYLANGACIGSSAPMREKIIDPKVICSNSRTM